MTAIYHADINQPEKRRNMKTKQILSSLILIAAFLITACGGTSTPTEDAMMKKDVPTEEAMMEKETPTADAMMEKETPTADAMMSKETPAADAMMETPAWYSASLTNVSTGQTFTVNDFKGKVILVETMAIWCSTCFRQQGQVKALHDLLGQRDDFVSIGLDVDPNEDAASLKSYVEKNGFDWLYAVATTEVAQDISKHYGDQFLNPPSAPIVVIDRKGEAHPMPFGVKSADELLQFIQPFLDEAM
jgi:cytochrome oxidase Cu insertion factor (SCO1/SenC/PrrC family)